MLAVLSCTSVTYYPIFLAERSRKKILIVKTPVIVASSSVHHV